MGDEATSTNEEDSAELAPDVEAESGDSPLQESDQGPEAGESAGTGPPERWRRLRWVFTRRLCFGGLAGALVFFLASTTPSLVPRSWLFQGIVSGVSVAIGYGLGSALSAGIRKVRNDEPSAHAKKIAWRVLLAASIVIGAVALFWGAEWQQDVRRLMEMDQLKVYEWGLILLIGLVLAGVVLVVSRLIRGFSRVVIRFLDRFMPRVAAVVGGVVIVVLVLIGLVQGVLFDSMVAAVNQSYALIDKGTSPGISQPESELRSGSAESLVDWDTLGIKGRDFTGDGGGPTPGDIEAYTGEPALQPIRVYVGLKSADSLDERSTWRWTSSSGQAHSTGPSSRS